MLFRSDEVSRSVRSLDQVTFPVPHRRTHLDFGRASVDHPLVSNAPASPTIVTRTASSAFAVRARQVSPQIPTGLGIRVDVLVDRLLAHPGAFFKASPTADHLGRPALAQALLSVPLDLFGEPTRPGPPGSLLSHPVRLSRLVAVAARIPRDLSADRARRPTQSPGHLPRPVSGLTPHPDEITFCLGHAFVSHYVLHVFLAHEERNLPRDRFYSSSVALATRARAPLKVGLESPLNMKCGEESGTLEYRHDTFRMLPA